MASSKITLNHAGMAEMLRSAPVASAVRAAATATAANASFTLRNGTVLPVEVSSGFTDRARSVVTIAHPAALAVEARYGLLRRSAAAVGLDVNSRLR